MIEITVRVPLARDSARPEFSETSCAYPQHGDLASFEERLARIFRGSIHQELEAARKRQADLGAQG